MVTQQDTQKRNIFRQEALDRVASPEQLDQLIKVTNPKRWFSLLALGSLVAVGTAWSVFGRIPIVVSGRGVLIYPSKVVTVQAANPGRILALNVQVGDRVRKGQVIATIDQAELRKQLQLAREKLVQLRFQDETANQVQTQRSNLEEIAIQQQRQTLQRSLEIVQSLTPALREQTQTVMKRERLNLQQRIQTLQELLPIYHERWQKRKKLLKEGAVPQDTALQAEQDYKNAQAQINEAKSQLNQLELRETDTERQYMNNLNQINEIQTQLKALESRQATQKEQDFTTVTNRKKEIQETQRVIAQLELQLQKTSQIVSDYTGRILEITAKPGQQLEPGGGIGTIAANEESAKLVNVAFLPVSEGKKIKPGMSLQVTPSTVKREEFGGIEAKVKNISAFPVTQQGVASLIGNPDILPGILSQGAQIAVFSELQPDTSTNKGYRWSSSKGPDLEITAGTTTSVRITVEERAPITFVLPIFKSLTGLG
ncbi:NHLP bacteriocin system secretion protein [Tolypothrix sp. FACHB-123]|uniref:NHLP bacteriocin system secretion protein n=1 Tax=Tolypothrix sp. FACHB-123 TaxID=2692868 RepID=UPI0016828405|nr:NHLP bacteriocin system secretion protein [Tolypothrix sp. FACHB-123]MBD2353020.1 NHLP bacteriocin system secretion protein [Tolypothrix sp. FACHB-123]